MQQDSVTIAEIEGGYAWFGFVWSSGFGLNVIAHACKA